MTVSPDQRGVCLRNGDISGIGVTSLRIAGDRIDGLGVAPGRRDIVIDLRGDRVLPGLINAHDHLQLNNFPRVRYRSYRNVLEWIEDVDMRRQSDRDLAKSCGVDRDARLWFGGLKNLLSGVTTVAHHDPFYPCLGTKRFPVHVLADYGWSHSLALDGRERVRRSYRNTPKDLPWFIHAGEGLDHAAASELEVLDALGCIGPNSRLIHGVAFDDRSRRLVSQSGAALIWCPGSNVHLFGQSAQVTDLAAQGRVALGTDSRLSGERDLLAELRLAHGLAQVPSEGIETLVTSAAAICLGLRDRGELRVGNLADLLIAPAGVPLWELDRADIRCVIRDGVMCYGDSAYAEVLLPSSERTFLFVDGHKKVLRSTLVSPFLDLREDGVRWVEAGRAA